MNVFEASLFDTKTGETIQSQNITDTNSTEIYVKGGNEEKSKLPMVFNIYGDFTIYKEIAIDKPFRFKADGIDEEVKLLEMTNEMIKIETSREVGKKLRAAGL